jgi:hypothetical protein
MPTSPCWSASPPAPLAFDGRGIGGLPDRILPLDELGELLVAGVPTPIQDAVWRQLAVAARSWGRRGWSARSGWPCPG